MRNSIEVRVLFLETTTLKYLESRDNTLTTTKPLLRELAFIGGLPSCSKENRFWLASHDVLKEESDFIHNKILCILDDSLINHELLSQLFKDIKNNHYLIWNLYVLSSWLESIECETEWTDS